MHVVRHCVVARVTSVAGVIRYGGKKGERVESEDGETDRFWFFLPRSEETCSSSSPSVVVVIFCCWCEDGCFGFRPGRGLGGMTHCFDAEGIEGVRGP